MRLANFQVFIACPNCHCLLFSFWKSVLFQKISTFLSCCGHYTPQAIGEICLSYLYLHVDDQACSSAQLGEDSLWKLFLVVFSGE
jgi:hypothetical protein